MVPYTCPLCQKNVLFREESEDLIGFLRASKRSPRQGYGCVSKRSPQWLRRGPVKEVQRGYDNPVKEFPVVTAALVERVKFGFNSRIMTELNVSSSDKDMEVKKE